MFQASSAKNGECKKRRKLLVGDSLHVPRTLIALAVLVATPQLTDCDQVLYGFLPGHHGEFISVTEPRRTVHVIRRRLTAVKKKTRGLGTRQIIM